MKIQVEGGWKEEIFDNAKKVLTDCAVCKKEIDLKIKNSFGVIKEPAQYYEHIYFLCKKCFRKFQNFICDMVRSEKKP